MARKKETERERVQPFLRLAEESDLVDQQVAAEGEVALDDTLDDTLSPPKNCTFLKADTSLSDLYIHQFIKSEVILPFSITSNLKCPDEHTLKTMELSSSANALSLSLALLSPLSL